MRTIGLIGGMSWESTSTYYRLINEAVRQRRGGLHSAEMVIRSFDFAHVSELQRAGLWEQAGLLLAKAGACLARSGADCVLICTNTMHVVAAPVAAMAGVPLIDIIDETALALRADGRRRPLLLATRYTMEHGFYTARMADHGIEVVLPDAEGRAIVHDVIFDELCQGRLLNSSRLGYVRIIDSARAAGADSIILGCTEISLLIDPSGLSLPGYDSTAIHAAAAVRFAMG